MRKTTLVLAAALIIALLFPWAAASGSAKTIYSSEYWGGTQTAAGYQNVLGSKYTVADMTVTQAGNTVTVTLSGGYFANYVDNPTIAAPGDLFISSGGWLDATNVDPSRPYHTDTFKESEGWDFVVQAPTAPGDWQTTNVYSIDGLQWHSGGIWDNTVIQQTSGTGLYRKYQAWRKGDGAGALVGTARSRLMGTPQGGSDLIFEFDVDLLGITGTTEVGLHWTMKCGNDILEGSAPLDNPPVPLPSTVLLLFSGLASVAFVQRKRGFGTFLARCLAR